MKPKTLIITIVLTAFLNPACGKEYKDNKSYKPDFQVNTLKDTTGNTIATRFTVPEGYERIRTDSGTFGNYLQNLPLKPAGTKVYNYDGTIKKPENVYEAVVDIDVGKRDLQQCADAIMRLRAEYLYGQGRFNEIRFNFTNGFDAKYQKWREGYRIKVKGNKSNWVKGGTDSESYESFREYLDIVFMYAGTLSLSRELEPAGVGDMKIGDIFIFGGTPGHAVIIVDMAVNKQTGSRLFIIAQSFMPAQDIQILKNPDNSSFSPWYDADFGDILITPEWKFSRDELKRF